MPKSDLKIVTAKISPEDYEKLKERAEENHRSMAGEIAAMIAAALK